MQEKLVQTLLQALAALLLAIPAGFERPSLGWVLLADTLDEILAADCAVPASLPECKAVVSLLLRRLGAAAPSELALLLHVAEAFQVEGDAAVGEGAKQDLAGFLETRLEECVARCEANAGKSQRMQKILGWPRGMRANVGENEVLVMAEVLTNLFRIGSQRLEERFADVLRCFHVYPLLLSTISRWYLSAL